MRVPAWRKRRLALAGTIAFLGMNGVRLTLDNDEAYEQVMAVATGQLIKTVEIAEQIRGGCRPR